MNPLSIEFKNYKLLKEEKFEFNAESYVYFVVGSNNKGKTSFLNALLSILEAKNTTPNPVSFGEKEGEVKFDFETESGSLYTAKFEFTNEKGKFTLISADGMTTTKVTEIRQFFDHHNITAEEFVNMGNNKQDRKKQRDIFLNLMEPEHKQALLDAEASYQNWYEKRTAINRDKKAVEATMTTAITKEERELLDKQKELQAEKENLDLRRRKQDEFDIGIGIDKNNLEAMNLKLNNLNNTDVTLTFENTDREIQSEIERLEAELERQRKKKEENIKAKGEAIGQHELEIKAVKNEIAMIETKLSNTPSAGFDSNRYAEVVAMIDQIRNVNAKAGLVEENKLKLNKFDEEYNTANKNVESYAESCRLILTNNLPAMENIEVHADGLYYKEEGNDPVPFVESQVGTAEIYLVTLRILLALNKKTPIIVMGRAESLDNNMLHDINLIAEAWTEKTGQKVNIIFDRVLPQEDNIQMVGFENFEETIKSNINKS